MLYFIYLSLSVALARESIGRNLVAGGRENDGVVGGKRSVQFWALLHNR